MAISFEKLWTIIQERGITWSQIRYDLGISSTTVAKINKNEYISLQTLDMIAMYLDVDISDLISSR